ncbi:MAG: DegV family protein [Clostridia bacterium]|nr:DegV family protein [Clostridia bacterium]
MAFAVFADGAANLPGRMLDGISLLSCDYVMDGKACTYQGDLDRFDGHAYYEKLRAGHTVQTSLLNTEKFLNAFTPILKAGKDVIYISMSSGISGTYNAAVAAAQSLMESFSGRLVHIVDSLGCGFGNGMLAIKAAELNRQGMETREAARILEEEVPHTCQYFTVDDLNFLKRTGRVNGLTAKIATVLNIKPILFGDSTGHIVSCEKVRGRKKSIEALVARYRIRRTGEKHPNVYISHGDCLQDAEQLEEMILEETPDAKVEICQHEPFSGAHVGPGMLGLFFRGKER